MAYTCLRVYKTDNVDVSLNYSRMRSFNLNSKIHFRFLVVCPLSEPVFGLFWFNPGADSENLIEIQRDLLLLNEPLDLSLGGRRQNPHQGLGSESVLGSLLVVTLGHVSEHEVGGLVNVVDDLSEVGLEVGVSQSLEIGQSCRGDVSLPLEVALASINKLMKTSNLCNEVHKGSLNLKILSGDRALAGGRESHSGLLVGINNLSGLGGSIPHVGSEDNDVEVLVDVVHNLGLEECLGRVIHDLVAQLGLSNVLPELLDASATSLRGTVAVNDLVSIVLGSSTIGQLGE